MRVTAVAIAFSCIASVSVARAGGDLGTTIDLALENYDLGDYTAAKLQLEGALKDAAGDPATVARGHLALGAVYVKLGNEAGAKASFRRALDTDETARPEARYADKAVTELFEAAKAERDAATSCDGIAALAHSRGDPGKEGEPYELSVLAGNKLGAASVVASYRTDPAATYAELEMTKTGECEWTVKLPALSGEQLEYHFAAKNESGTTVAAHGSTASPIAVLIEAGPEAPEEGPRPEDEVPDELGGKPPKPRGKGCAGCSGAGGAPESAVLVVLVCSLLAGRGRNTLCP